MMAVHIPVINSSFASSAGPVGDCGTACVEQVNRLETSMAFLNKSALLSLGMVAGVAFAAQAQTSGLASLPPNPTVAPPAAVSPVAPSAALPGPNPGGSSNPNTVATGTGVPPSEGYVGPAPGQGYYGMPPRFEKSADWDSNTGMHPYTSSMGPRPH
jgi:hypothetical protein